MIHTANEIKADLIKKHVYFEPAGGFRCAEVHIEKVDFGIFDDTSYSRVYRFMLDYKPKARFIAF